MADGTITTTPYIENLLAALKVACTMW